jgi:hypothetical protein
MDAGWTAPLPDGTMVKNVCGYLAGSKFLDCEGNLKAFMSVNGIKRSGKATDIQATALWLVEQVKYLVQHKTLADSHRGKKLAGREMFDAFDNLVKLELVDMEYDLKQYMDRWNTEGPNADYIQLQALAIVTRRPIHVRDSSASGSHARVFGPLEGVSFTNNWETWYPNASPICLATTSQFGSHYQCVTPRRSDKSEGYMDVETPKRGPGNPTRQPPRKNAPMEVETNTTTNTTSPITQTPMEEDPEGTPEKEGSVREEK